jgi:NADH-quinone oxidoreductase subunit C
MLKKIATHGFDWEERFSGVWQTHLQKLKAAFPEGIEKILLPQSDAVDIPVVVVRASFYLQLMLFLKQELQFDFLSDLTASDETPRSPRFDLICQLMSTKTQACLRVKTPVDEKALSLVSVFKAANWAEREVFDMFGIVFEGHPDLRRILMHEDWQGHPLRKDYPLKGYQIHPVTEPIHEALLAEENV